MKRAMLAAAVEAANSLRSSLALGYRITICLAVHSFPSAGT
jgi:hypothetical protein